MERTQESDSTAEYKKRVANLFSKLADNSLATQTNQDLLGGQLRIIKDITEKRDGFIVTLAGLTYYITDEGVMWISPPDKRVKFLDLEINYQSKQANIPVPEDKGTQMTRFWTTKELVEWTCDSSRSGNVKSNIIFR